MPQLLARFSSAAKANDAAAAAGRALPAVRVSSSGGEDVSRWGCRSCSSSGLLLALVPFPAAERLCLSGYFDGCRHPQVLQCCVAVRDSESGRQHTHAPGSPAAASRMPLVSGQSNRSRVEADGAIVHACRAEAKLKSVPSR